VLKVLVVDWGRIETRGEREVLDEYENEYENDNAKDDCISCTKRQTIHGTAAATDVRQEEDNVIVMLYCVHSGG